MEQGAWNVWMEQREFWKRRGVAWATSSGAPWATRRDAAWASRRPPPQLDGWGGGGRDEKWVMSATGAVPFACLWHSVVLLALSHFLTPRLHAWLFLHGTLSWPLQDSGPFFLTPSRWWVTPSDGPHFLMPSDGETSGCSSRCPLVAH